MHNEFTSESDRRVFRLIPIDMILTDPAQPRKYFDSDGLSSLADSIREVGIIQPLTVSYAGDGFYRVIAGERRLRACRIAGISGVPCIVIDASGEKKAIITLSENLQRKDLNFFEQACGIEAVMREFELNQNEIAEKIGKSQSAVANKLRLLKIPVPVREQILASRLSERHARALLRLPTDKMAAAVEYAVKKKMSIGELEEYTVKLNNEHNMKTVFNPEESLKAFSTKKNRCKGSIGDMRICINTISRTINMLKSAGVTAEGRGEDFEDKYVYTIIIKK